MIQPIVDGQHKTYGCASTIVASQASRFGGSLEPCQGICNALMSLPGCQALDEPAPPSRWEDKVSAKLHARCFVIQRSANNMVVTYDTKRKRRGELDLMAGGIDSVDNTRHRPPPAQCH